MLCFPYIVTFLFLDKNSGKTVMSYRLLCHCINDDYLIFLCDFLNLFNLLLNFIVILYNHWPAISPIKSPIKFSIKSIIHSPLNTDFVALFYIMILPYILSNHNKIPLPLPAAPAARLPALCYTGLFPVRTLPLSTCGILYLLAKLYTIWRNSYFLAKHHDLRQIVCLNPLLPSIRRLSRATQRPTTKTFYFLS